MLAALMAGVLAAWGCDDDEEPAVPPCTDYLYEAFPWEHYIYGHAAVGDTIALDCRYIIGSNGCYSFVSFDFVPGDMRADLTVWGRYYACSDWSCESTAVYWTAPQILLEPTRAGWFRFVFHLRDGEVVRDSVLVVAKHR